MHSMQHQYVENKTNSALTSLTLSLSYPLLLLLTSSFAAVIITTVTRAHPLKTNVNMYCIKLLAFLTGENSLVFLLQHAWSIRSALPPVVHLNQVCRVRETPVISRDHCTFSTLSTSLLSHLWVFFFLRPDETLNHFPQSEFLQFQIVTFFMEFPLLGKSRRQEIFMLMWERGEPVVHE